MEIGYQAHPMAASMLGGMSSAREKVDPLTLVRRVIG
jgi:hypothetical protein